uniref:Uncharacterized protein n=1 Tax=Avena sativa TaxID=4498 RepID=A0ACD5XDS1_AVESA
METIHPPGPQPSDLAKLTEAQHSKTKAKKDMGDGEFTKRVHAVLLLALIACFAVHGQCRGIGVNKEAEVAYVKRDTIPSCNLDKHNYYCCTTNLACYETVKECKANCSVLSKTMIISPSP